MDHATFDHLSRRLASGTFRRSVVGGVLAAATGRTLAALGRSPAGADDVTSENCIPEGKRCGKGKR